jgi:NADH-quinone oxidoreductase subunit N
VPVIVLVLTSVLGLYYYLRIISLLFAEVPETAVRKEKSLHPLFYTATYAALIVLMLLLFWIGIFPGTIIDASNSFYKYRFRVRSFSSSRLIQRVN